MSLAELPNPREVVGYTFDGDTFCKPCYQGDVTKVEAEIERALAEVAHLQCFVCGGFLAEHGRER